MKTVLILHGTMGSPEGNWFQWIKTELEAKGLRVWLPTLPHPEQPSLREEADYIHTHCPFPINEETLIVGHSSGSILALVLAQENKTKIGAVVAVSAFHDNSLKWDANNNLFDVSFNWNAMRKNVNKLFFVHSDTDPYVPLEQAKYVADSCKAEMVVLPSQGHFNLEQSESYREFPKLIELIYERGVL